MEELEITHLSDRGYGRGKSIDVKGAFKRETVVVDIRKKRGRLLSIQKSSPDRVVAKCSHAVECGGCSLQGLSYEAQVEEKLDRYKALFQQPFDPPLLAEEIYYYRNKMEFSFSETKANDQYLGLILAGTRGHVFNLQECHLIKPWVASIVQAVRSWWFSSKVRAFNPFKAEGSLRTLTCRTGIHTEDKMVLLTVSGNPQYALTYEEVLNFKQTVQKALDYDPKLSIFLILQHAKKGVETTFSEMHLCGKAYLEESLFGFTFTLSPLAFFQPNPKMAERMIQHAIKISKINAEDIVLDLYCGVGMIGIAFSPFVKKVVGVELNPYAVYDAKRNVELNNISNMEVLRGDVATILPTLQKINPSIIIVDPPRAGLDPKTIDLLLTIRPTKILYISCNPKSQKENLFPLLEGGYQLNALIPVDQFPMTMHLESIALLTRS